MKNLLLLATASALLAACGAKETTSTTAPAGDTAATSTAADASAGTDAATATQESAGSEDTPGDVSLERLVGIPDNVLLPNGKWKSGTHYFPVVPAQNTSAEPGQVEVLEFMWLGCAHCADLEPDMVAWEKKKPTYVKFVQEHVMWGPAHKAHGRLLYTLQTLNRSDLVPKAFEEIHKRQNMLVSLKNDEAETYAIQLAFAKANGISEADFKREYNGFTVKSRLQRSEELNRRYKVDSVPMIFVNGKYQTSVGDAGGKQQMLNLITDLAAAEKGR